MTGLIWLVQLVHYPLFRYADIQRFAKMHEFHSRQITWIVFPVMTIELISGLALAFTRGSSVLWVNFSGIILIWACTGLLSVPIHNRLATEQSPELIERLIFTNWPRTGLWTARALLLLSLSI
jgi:hypothetical protein